MKQWYIMIFYLALGYSALGQTVNDTTIRLSTGSIKFTENNPAQLPDYFEHQAQIDSIARLFDNSYERAVAIEHFQLSKFKPGVKIDSTIRYVKLKNGKRIKLALTDSVQNIGYTFEKEFKDKESLLFKVQWSEGFNYLLLNTKTGKKVYTIGRVYFNKKGNYMISINDDIVSHYSENGFQLFKIDNNGLKEVWKYAPAWAPEKIAWLDNETLLVQGYRFCGSSPNNKKPLYKKIRINLR